MLLCWGQRCASNFVSAVCVRQLPVSFVHKAGAHKETALNNCDRPSRKPDVNVIQHLFGDESGNWRSCWTSPSKFLQSGSKIAARLNPEPEVIVIIFTIIMWVKCLGVHTLLYIYGSFDSLCPSLSQLVSLSLSAPAACLTSFLSSQRTRIPASLHRKEWSLSSQLPNLCRCLAKQGQKQIIPKRRC